MLKESIKSVGINYEREEIAKHNILPLPVEDKTSECYNCLVLCKGMPFHVDTARIREFFNPYKLVEKYTIFIKDKKGNFFGDVMVRFTNKKEKLLALKNKNFKFLMHRYIQLYNINEEHYEEYFNVGYKNPPSYKNYVPIKNVVVSSALEDLDPLAEERSTDGDGTLSSVHPTSDDKYQYHSFFCDPLDNDVETKELRDKVNKKGILLKSIYTGKKLRGRITSVHPYGVFVDCDVYVKDKNGRFIKILALLHKNKLTINIGLPTDPLPEQEEKELILQKNMNIIVYVDKIIKRDIDPSGSNSKDGKNNLIFFNLTFDSSITEEKIQWLQSLKLKRKSIEEKMKACNDRFLSMSSEGGVTGGLGGGAPEVREKESPWEGNNPSKVVGTDITEETNKSEGITVLKGEKMSSSQKLCNVQSCKTEEFFSSEEKDESKLNSSSKNKRNHNNDSDVYDEDDNFDEIFKLEVGDAEGQEEVYSGNENVDRVADSENAAIEQDSLSDDKNKRSEKKVTNHYNDEMKGILDDIFRKEEDGGSPSKKASMKVRTDKCNQGTTVEQTLGQCFENVSDRSKWKNDIRKEESIFYSKMFGLKTDINDFYSDGSRGKDTDGVGSNSDNMEEFMKLSEGAGEGGDSSNDIHSETIKFEGLESWMEQGKKDEMIEEEELEGEEEPIKEQAGEELEQGGLNMEQANGDPMNSIITGKDGEALDFSHFAEMTTEELKSEIYKKKFLLPIDVSRESLKNRLVQIYICEKNKIKFDNYPFIRYYLFDFNVPVEDIKLFVLANKKFLNKKNINLNLLNSLNLNELKYLLHKSMENIRLWEPEDKIKRKILNLNNDLLQKQNMNNVDDVDANNLLILWNDFKDFLLNCVYGNDTTSDSWGADFRNLSTTNCEPTTSYSTNNANTQKYLNRMKNMEKENFFIGKKIPVDDELEKQINKKKMKHMDPFENALSTLNKELDENEAELPDKISLKEAMKILNNRSYMKKIKRALNNDSDERTNEEYIDKIISLILKHKNYFKENLSEAILRKKPHEELIILLDQLPADLIEDLL